MKYHSSNKRQETTKLFDSCYIYAGCSNCRYLYTVGLDGPHTFANSLRGLRQSIVILPAITSRKRFYLMRSMISHSCCALRERRLTSSVKMVSLSSAAFSNVRKLRFTSKPTNEVKDSWNAKAYDDLRACIPKGRRADVEAYVASQQQSVNDLINSYLREALGMSEMEWKRILHARIP